MLDSPRRADAPARSGGATLRVLHVIGCFPPATEWGGAASAAAALVDATSSAGVETEVFTTTQRSSRRVEPLEAGTFRRGAARVTRFRSVHALQRGFVAPAMARALWRRVGEFDLVHLHMMWTFPTIVAAWACRARRVPYVISPHGALDPWGLGQRQLEKRVFLALAERANLSSAALLHFTTDGERRSVPEWVRRLPAAVVPNPVDAGTFERLGAGGGRPSSRNVLILGRIHPVKGFDVLLPAWKRVVEEEPGARLVVAGPDEGGYAATVRALVDDLGVASSVEFLGLVEGASRDAAMEAAALLVAPSQQENFGMAVAEAMAAALPVVVSDAVKLSDDVAAAGAGRVVTRDPTTLAAALVGLLRDSAGRMEMGRAGRRWVRERYAPATVGAGLRAAYEGVLRGRHGGTSAAVPADGAGGTGR